MAQQSPTKTSAARWSGQHVGRHSMPVRSDTVSVIVPIMVQLTVACSVVRCLTSAEYMSPS